jgi:hypothetical protein
MSGALVRRKDALELAVEVNGNDLPAVNSRLSVSPECATEATTAGTQLVASPIEPER